MSISQIGRRVLPVLLLVLAFVLAVQQSGSGVHAAEPVSGMIHVSAPADCPDAPNHATGCCSTTASLPATAMAFEPGSYPAAQVPGTRFGVLAPNPQSRLFRPPRRV